MQILNKHALLFIVYILQRCAI